MKVKRASKAAAKPEKKSSNAKATLSSDSSKKQILEYLESQHRPFTVIDLHNNLSFPKPHLVKMLEELTADNLICCKTYKQSLYYCKQPKTEITKAVLEAKEAKKVLLEKQLQALKDTVSINIISNEDMLAALNRRIVFDYDAISRYGQGKQVLVERKSKFYEIWNSVSDVLPQSGLLDKWGIVIP